MKSLILKIINFFRTIPSRQQGYLKISALFLVGILILKKVIPVRFVDDWQYEPVSYGTWSGWEDLILISSIVLVTILLIGLIWSIVWIVKGKSQAVDGEIISDKRRIVGKILVGVVFWPIFSGVIFSGVVWVLGHILSFNWQAKILIIFTILLAGFTFFAVFIRPFLVIQKYKLGKAYFPYFFILIGVIFVLFYGVFGLFTRTFGVGGMNSFSTGSSFGIHTGVSLSNSAISSVSFEPSEKIGFSVGGAKDIDNFRQKIQNRKLPKSSDISYEGIFYDYYFDTTNIKDNEICDELFCPTYNTAKSPNVFSKEEEYYMTVGFNSNISQKDFERKQLNIAVVLDISGSMSSSFDEYYGNRRDSGEEFRSKMNIATQSIVNMIDHLGPYDQLSVILFDGNGYLAKPFRVVNRTDMDAIKQHILDLKPRGGTSMEAGINLATKEFLNNSEFFGNDALVENRIIFLTDALPNIGATSKENLASLARNNAKEGINMTFIGMGIDFNTELISEITKVRGANYYAVHSANDFKKRLDDEFDFMVTPLVYDLSLSLESLAYEIDSVYGVAESKLVTGEIMKIGTLFPSENKEGEVRGGVVLLKLNKDENIDDSLIQLTVSYIDSDGERHRIRKKIEMSNIQSPSYDSNGIRKAIALTRYVNLMKEFTSSAQNVGGEIIIDKDFSEKFNIFEDYFDNEINNIEDYNLINELEIIQDLIVLSIRDINIREKNIFGDLLDVDLVLPRIMYWPGKVNQHYNIQASRWETDSDGRSGANLDKLNYCRKVYPSLGIVDLREYRKETINTWHDAGNIGSYTSTRQSFECVQG